MTSSDRPAPQPPAPLETATAEADRQIEPRERNKEEQKADKEGEKQRKKEEKRLRDAHRPLDAWERYRALVDTLEEGHQMLEIADRKVRFALVVMAALNVLLFVLVTRVDMVELIPDALRSWIGAYMVVYAFVAVYFFLQAIESLRPRRFRPHLHYPGPAGADHYPMGLRYYEDVVLRDLEAYRRAWRDVRLGQLNAELAVQAHIMARTNLDKYTALRRLFAGLRVMTLLGAGLITAVAFSVFLRPGEASLPRVKGGKHASSNVGASVLGTPSRMTQTGVREPSGVAYHPGLGHFFVVGDEGRLVELDGEGRALGSQRIKGDLEDVAVHTPSGNLLLLAEKRSELVWYDPTAHEERKRWRLDDAAVLGEAPGDKNQGFEGLALRGDPSRPGGGVFYLVHQRSPSMIAGAAFDPQRPAGVLGGDVVVDRWSMKGHHDLTAATYVPSLDRLLVIADARDRLLVVRMDGSTEAETALPGVQQEGLCLDPAGNLWVADDRSGLLRFDGALQTLTSWLQDKQANPSQ